jgi:hypothetical protein
MPGFFVLYQPKKRSFSSVFKLNQPKLEGKMQTQPAQLEEEKNFNWKLWIPLGVVEAILIGLAIFGGYSIYKNLERPSLSQIDSIVIMDKTGEITHRVNDVHVWDVQTGQVYGTKNYIIDGEVEVIKNSPPNGQ